MKKTYLIKYVFLLFFVVSAAAAFAQTNVVSGKIVDETNQPLPGATVTVKGTQKSTGADANGNFRLTGVTNGIVTLQISFIGYLTTEKVLNVSGNVTVNVQLTPNAKGLNEVVVIGYGTARKKDLTGSITNITSKDFNTGSITTPEQLIQGKVAGVSVISNSGAPGAGSTIQIRGVNSLNGSTKPLIVIDGVPLDNTAIAGAANPLDLINPNDIESFSILKDASAAAIYGNRASGGVIMITTKKGKSGKPAINFSTQLSAAKLVKETGVLTPDQFRQFVTANDTGAKAGQYTKFLGNSKTDWQKEIFQTGITSNSNISVSGTTGKLPYRVSAGYFDQTGILKTSSLKRYTGSINLSPSLFTDHLKINFNATGTQVNERFADEGAIGNAFAFNPTVPVYSGNNNFGGYTQYINADGTLQKNTPINPVGVLNQKRDLSTVYRGIVSLALDYKFHFLPDLHANVNLAYDGSKGSGTTTVSDSSAAAYQTTNVNGTLEGGSRSKYLHTYDNKLFEGYLSYGKDLKGIHSRIDAVAGYSYQDYADNQHNYESEFYDGTPNALTIPTYALTTNEYRLMSYYGRVTYAFMDKYILSGTIRDDLSSKFAPGLQSGIFPSGSFAWRIKEEDFLKDNQAISDLKLRVGYGVTGNQDGLGDYDYLADYSVSSKTAQYQVGGNYYQMYRPGAYYFNRTWEQTATTNVGLDYGFLNNRITGTVDYYYKKTSKLLATIGQAALANFSNQIVGNIGSMENNGIEFNINADVIQKKDIRWNVGFNIAYNHNKILALPGATAAGLQGGAISGGTGSKVQESQVGDAAHSFYVLQQVYGTNGLPLENVFVDRNADGSISDKDLYIYQTSDPKEIMGLNSNFTYKKWSAGFSARANLGNYVYNNVASNRGIVSNFLQSVSGGYIINGSNAVLDSHLIGLTANDRLSDYYVQNASFFKMDDMHIGYTFGGIFNNSATLGITADVQNVFTITNYKGVDPELANGIDNQIYPRPRTYTLGLNLNIK